MTVRTSSVATVIKRLTGANLEATREFLLRDCFVPGKGFSSQYAGQGTVSCTTSAICIYALSETGHLTQRQKRGFTRVLLAFRAAMQVEEAGAFPRTTGGELSAWTTVRLPRTIRWRCFISATSQTRGSETGGLINAKSSGQRPGPPLW